MAIDGEANEREAEVARVMQICNACRYCETYCAVFPAMTRRLQFDAATTHYLANLCHNCGACLHACQYAAPHPFAVNVPRSMAKVRGITYQQYAWPRALGTLYQRNGLVVALALATGISLFILLLLALDGHLSGGAFGSNFYAIYPHEMLVQVFGVTFGWAAIALGVGVSRFWRDQAPGGATAVPVAEAVGNILKLTYLAGGHGEGCNERDDRYTLARRVLHHFTFYGFLSCGAATVVATFYHYVLGLHAPYALSSLPVLLGTLGGIGLLLGPAGLLWLNLQRHPLHGDPEQKPMDRAFIALLLLASASGLALLAWRSTPAMAALLAIHLGCIIALFATLPYGKFAHAVYRSAALLKWSIERRRPNPVTLSAD